MLAKELLNGQPGPQRWHCALTFTRAPETPVLALYKILEARRVRPFRRRQHLWLPVSQQAEVRGLQEEAHAP